MRHLKTYRYRLTIYTALLLVFLLAILSYTYYSSRSILLNESGLRVNTTTQVISEYLDLEEQELLHYAEIVGDDQRIQEYMFMVVKVGTDAEPLHELYQRHFGWLPVAHRLLITNTGRVLLGKEYPELAMEVLARISQTKDEIFYLQSNRGVDMITWAPINYQGESLGFVALVTSIDEAWIERRDFLNNGYIFVEHNGVMQLSNLAGSRGKTFKLDKKGYAHIGGQVFRVGAVLNNPGGTKGNQSSPRIWYGVSENNVLEKLSSHGLLILGLGLLGASAILIVGLMILRNFNAPLSKLTGIAQQVANGSLPILHVADEQNEIDVLSNQFANMLQALREKQQEIDRVHKELQHSAITDSLTGLNNRRYLNETFPRIFAQAQRDELYLFGILLDIDHFKQINDTHGHLGGDECLIHVAKTLELACRTNDYIFRVGGEEFFVLSVGETLDGGKQLAEKLRSTLEKNPATYAAQIIPITASIGINHADFEQQTMQALTQLLFTADNALYCAKSAGRNRVEVYRANESPPVIKQHG